MGEWKAGAGMTGDKVVHFLAAEGDARNGVLVGLMAGVPHIVITQRNLLAIAAELGETEMDAGFKAAYLWLYDRCVEYDRPIGVNMPMGKDESMTSFIAPKTWTPERLQGYVSTSHAALADTFGEAEHMSVIKGKALPRWLRRRMEREKRRNA